MGGWLGLFASPCLQFAVTFAYRWSEMLIPVAFFFWNGSESDYQTFGEVWHMRTKTLGNK